MRLVSKLNQTHVNLLRYTPLQYMLRALEQNPDMGKVYEGDDACAARIGPLLFFGGKPGTDCLNYLKSKILTFEIYEKYRVFYFFYPSEEWKNALDALYPGKCREFNRSLYAAEKPKAMPLPGCIVPISPGLIEEKPENVEMIFDEVTTYKSFERFLECGIGYTLFINGKIQGFCTSEYQSDKELAIGIEVLEEYQRKGYGKAMASALLNSACARGFKVFWECRSDNMPSVQTALSCGFSHVADYNMLFADFSEMHRKLREPSETEVKEILTPYIQTEFSVRRVPQGASTYVYRVQADTKTYYARFLPENATFACEVLAHQEALNRGVPVPKISLYLEKEEKTGLSMMLAEEIPGTSLEYCPLQNPAPVLFEAGRSLAALHTIHVDGFGWIDRAFPNALKGEKKSFADFFNDYLEDDLTALDYYGITGKDNKNIRHYMNEAANLLKDEQAVLVHGDFDVSHIFHRSGKLTGLIDFGEIRGCCRYFDLAAFALFTENRENYSALLEGYSSVYPLNNDDLYKTELMALFIALRFAGKKEETSAREFWRGLLLKQLRMFCD